MAFYTGSSPYASTQIIDDQYLDLITIRPVPAKSDDVLYTVEPQYNHRPDLLAYDIYGNEKLWWVFAQRNMDSLKDPVYDFRSGLQIYVSKGSKLRQLLGE